MMLLLIEKSDVIYYTRYNEGSHVNLITHAHMYGRNIFRERESNDFRSFSTEIKRKIIKQLPFSLQRKEYYCKKK